MAKPAFTDSFPVERDNYGDFIRLVRQDVIKYCSDKRPGIDQPVLPPEKPVPELWFFISLSTKATRSLTLAIRMDNLYLVGFKTPAGVWWEFGKDGDTHLIDRKSKFLGFGGRYQDLIGDRGLDTVTLGRREMVQAVDYLANYTGTPTITGSYMPSSELEAGGVDPYFVVKSKLVKLVIMICEGVRFFTVQGTVDKRFDDVVPARITQREGKQVQKWDRICKAVFKWADDPTARFPDLQALGINDKNDAAKIVALVKDQN
ncbi:hypothetical protein ACP70R_023834 [Stipagrostis hirtigluma subsp. patula]